MAYNRNNLTGVILASIALMMVGLSFAAVPLYDLFCRTTGLAGTVQEDAALPDRVLDREITVRFNSDIDKELPWEFEPEIPKTKLKLGEGRLVAFKARNLSDQPVTGVALYNVSPFKAGQFFLKIQCFCFDEQVLEPGQEVNMPVYFSIDPALDDDPNMQDVTTITLSYSFYKAGSKTLDEAKQNSYE